MSPRKPVIRAVRRTRAAAAPSTERSPFVFRGSVQKLRAANVEAVPSKSDTAVVRVDELLEASASFQGYRGKDITVQLTPGARLKKGDQRIFHTSEWIFAKNLAVKAHDVKPVEATGRGRSAMSASHLVGDPEENLQARRLLQHFDKADVVVRGRVRTVREPKAPPAARTRARGSSEPTKRRVSEHDPNWREAVIAIDGVDKGSTPGNEVVIRFAGSRDIAWYASPKFRAGDSGAWLLHRAAAAPRTRVRAGFPAPSGAKFEVVHQEDFVPTKRLPQLGRIARAARGITPDR